MSINGYLLFRDYIPYVTSAFGYRTNPITNKYTLHAGVDYGTNGQKIPTYAIEDGNVVSTGFTNVMGNYVYVNYPRLNKNALYEHLDRISVVKGQSVTNDTIIGYVGETGNATGVHLHFGWFDSNEQSKSWNERNWQDFEKYQYIPIKKYLGSPTIRNKKNDQIEVLIDNLYVRNDANGEILGYISPGIYNILNQKTTNDYTWYQVEDNKWIAYSNTWANIYLKEDIVDIDITSDSNINYSKLLDKIINLCKNIYLIIKKILKYFHIL